MRAANPTPTADPADPAPRTLDQDCDLLSELAEIGLDLARTLQAETKATPTAPEHREATAAAFERIARAVRRTIHLRQHLLQTALTKTTQRTATRAQVIRQVENTIEDKAEPPDEEPLKAELVERLERPEFDHELETRPLPTIVAEICRDLGLANIQGSRQWPRRTPERLRTLYETAAQPPRDPDPPQPKPRPNGQSLLDHLLRER